MSNEQYERKEQAYTKKLKAGKKRTYFFDVKPTKFNDYYLVVTESRKRFNDDGYDRNSIFIHKEDFNNFQKELGDAIQYVKTELMPEFDFDKFNLENRVSYQQQFDSTTTMQEPASTDPPPTHNDSNHNTEEVDKW